MSRFYHYAFVGLISLLTVILLGLLLIVTDVSFSPTEHFADSNAAWSARKIRLSAEEALYNYWKHPLDLVNNSETSPQVVKDGRVQSPEGRKKINRDHRPISTAHLSSSNSEPPSQKPSVHNNAATFAKYVLLSKSASNSRAAITPSESTETVQPSLKSYWPGFGDEVSLSDAVEEHPVENVSTDDIEYPYTDEVYDDVYSAESDADADLNSTLAAAGLNHNEDNEGLEEWGRQQEKPSGAVEREENEGEDEEPEEEREELEDLKALFMKEMEEPEKANELDNRMPVHDIADEEKVNMGNASQNGAHPSPASLSLNPHHHASSTSAIKPSLMARSTDVGFHMPCRKVYRPINEIVTAYWMKPLLQILSSFEGKQVTLVIANTAYQDVLLNWLISAKVECNPPIENIIVVCLDRTLYDLLQSRDIPSILAPFSTVLNTNYRFRRFFELIMMIRLAFMRLINRLGYDCAMYDIDAIILKNPQPLYDKYADVDIVGSRGELPRELLRRWHVTICIGAVFIRSNTKTELYWEAVYSVRTKKGAMANDQIRLNYGLHVLHIQWQNSNYAKEKYNTPAVGSSSNGLNVVVLPYNTICRYGCRADMRDTYYIWHKGGSRDKESKKKGAKRGRTWFLKDKWNELHSNTIASLKGTEWLKRISIK